MKINKIEIKVSDTKLATDITLLVGQEEFLEELGRLREKWEITELKKLWISPPFQELLNIDNIILKDITDPKEIKKRQSEFNEDIEKILKKFNKGKNYKIIVEYALITGMIPEGVYRSSYFDVVTINEAEDLNKPENYQYVIVLSARAEQEDVLASFREFREHIKNKIQFEAQSHISDSSDIEAFHSGQVHKLDDTEKHRTLTKIQRNRELFMISYEDVLNGKSDNPLKAAQVYKIWVRRCAKNKGLDPEDKKRVICDCQYCTIFDNNTIQKGIDAYIEFLLKINKTKPQFLNL